MRNITHIIKHFSLFCGLGGGSLGLNRGRAEFHGLQARFECLGGIDSDAAAIEDFHRLTGTNGTVMDLFSREQYIAFHGKEPPADWREATPLDVLKAARNQRPDILITSAPCKGFSGLLSPKKAGTAKYQALNQLTVRGLFLSLEAWREHPPSVILFENVPRIQHRGRELLDQIVALLHSYGYVTAETTHDCGELGGLSQTRKRFLLIARQPSQIPAFVYEPEKKPLGSIGDVLSRMPLPGDPIAGAMHSVPSLQWKTWTRLALVEAGGDWRSLNRFALTADGYLRDYCMVRGHLQVPLADARYAGKGDYGQYGIKRWSETSGTVSSKASAGSGRYSIADPRLPVRHNNVYRVCRWSQHSPAVTGGTGPTSGGLAIADPRTSEHRQGVYGVSEWTATSGTVTSRTTPSNGRFSIADPRMPWGAERPNFNTQATYGVLPFSEPSGTVTSRAKHDTGPWSVADPRISAGEASDVLPSPGDMGDFRILAEDNCWHRPLTTLELAALQGLVDPEEHMELCGNSHSGWRERIGNAIPPAAATAIAGVIGRAILGAKVGETYRLSAEPVWVQPVAIALSVDQSIHREHVGL